MSKCPFNWFITLFAKTKSPDCGVAQHLRVTVSKNSDLTVNVALPAESARWLIDLIPDEVMSKIRMEGIPIDEIQMDLAKRTHLAPQKIFLLDETNRTINVWLE